MKSFGRITFAAALLLSALAGSASAQVLVKSGGGGGGTAGGDCTGPLASLTCLKTNGVNFGTSATVNIGTSGATIPLLNGNNTNSGSNVFSSIVTSTVSPPASNAAVTLTGTPFSGTASNSFPLLYLNNGAASSTLSTVGSYFGINAASGCTTTSNLIDMFVNGGATHAFTVNCLGTTSVAGGAITLASNGNITITSNFSGANGSLLVFGSRGILSSKAAGNSQLGAADVNGTPVVQTVTAQSAVTGSNLAGAAKTSFIGSLSTGSGLSGDLCLSTGSSGAGATLQNAAQDGLCIKGATQLWQFGKTYLIANLPTCNGTTANSYTVVTDATAPTYRGVLVSGGGVNTPVYCDGTSWTSH